MDTDTAAHVIADFIARVEGGLPACCNASGQPLRYGSKAVNGHKVTIRATDTQTTIWVYPSDENVSLYTAATLCTI